MTGNAEQAGTGRLCVEIVEAVASEAGVDPLALSPPLYDVVDTDALHRLIATGTNVSVGFDYAGYAVAVDGDGAVTVEGDEPTDPPMVDTAGGETP